MRPSFCWIWIRACSRQALCDFRYRSAVTKLSITSFRPALSKSTVNLGPSTAITAPGPNLLWNTRDPSRKVKESGPRLWSAPSINGAWRSTSFERPFRPSRGPRLRATPAWRIVARSKSGFAAGGGHEPSAEDHRSIRQSPRNQYGRRAILG